MELEKNAQLALAITLSEGRLTHARLCELSNLHPSEVSKVLRLRRAFPDTPNHEKQAYTKA